MERARVVGSFLWSGRLDRSARESVIPGKGLSVSSYRGQLLILAQCCPIFLIRVESTREVRGGTQRGEKARRGQGEGQVVKNCFFPEVLQGMQPEV